MSWRAVAVAAGFAVLAWVGYEIGRAGHDVPPAPPAGPSTLGQGTLSGRRIDGRSWSLDYDTATMSQDAASATIAHVRDGRIHRPGKPDIRVRADGVIVNTITNDFNVTGPLRLVEPLPGGKTRIFSTTGAQYIGASRTLIIEHPATIVEDGATVTVASIRIDFKSGRAVFGRIVGVKPGTSP